MARHLAKCSVAALLLTAVSLAMLAAPSAQAQIQTTGRNVTAVMVDAGPDAQYVKQGASQWAELDTSGRANFHFHERTRDDWSVYLVDQSRGVEIQLDLFRKRVTISEGGGPRRDLYTITRFTHMGSTYPDERRGGGWDNDRRDRDDRGRGTTEDVEVGPIWNQADAERKCRNKARELRGEWNGQWRTTAQGRMSVCSIDSKRGGGGRDDRDDRDDRGNGDNRGNRNDGVIRDIEVGPIWNQADAETKCRIKGRDMRGEWTGQWRTTVQGRMSVCEIRFR